MAVTTNFNTIVDNLLKTLHGAERATLANAIFTKDIAERDIARNHLLMLDTQSDDPVVLIDNSVDYKTFPYLDGTTCAANECTLDIPFEDKAWKLANYSCRVGICMRSFDKSFLHFFRTEYPVLYGDYVSRGNVWDDSYNSPLLDFILDMFKNNIEGTIWRVSYFADTSTDSADPNYPYLRGFDGFFTQAEANNGLRMTFNQVNPTGLEAYEALEQAYSEWMMSDWSGKEDVSWKMTKAFGGLIVRWLNGLSDKSQYNCECFSADGVTAMRTYNLEGLRIFGLPVEIEPDLDGVIKQLELDRPYRALLTYRTNMQIGTPNEGDIRRFDIFYDRKDKQIYVEGEVYIGAMLVEDNYVYIGAEVASV